MTLKLPKTATILFVASLIMVGPSKVFASDMNRLRCEAAFGHSLGFIDSRAEEKAATHFLEKQDEFTSDYPELEYKYQRVARAIDSRSATPLLSIVIPAYKEAQRLPSSIARMQRFLDRFPLPVEILVVVQKSPDRTLELTSAVAHGDPRFQIIDKPSAPQEGKGGTVRYGMQRASGKYVLFMDADLSTPLPEIVNFMDYFREHPDADVLIGDRRSQAKPEEQGRSLIRRAMSFTFNRLVQAVSVSGIEDTQCGFKAFTREAAQRIFALQSLNGFAFDVEVLILAEKLGYATEPLPVQWHDADGSTVDRLWDPLKMARDLVAIRRIVNQNLRAAGIEN